MNSEELKEQLLQGTFYYYKAGLWIQSKIYKVVIIEDDFVTVSFQDSYVDSFLKNIKAIRRLGNIIKRFKWCYILKDDEDECIGYIGQIEDK